jgi:hypothetical protein
MDPLLQIRIASRSSTNQIFPAIATLSPTLDIWIKATGPASMVSQRSWDVSLLYNTHIEVRYALKIHRRKWFDDPARFAIGAALPI